MNGARLSKVQISSLDRERPAPFSAFLDLSGASDLAQERGP
jgi:hypothetical protein